MPIQNAIVTRDNCLQLARQVAWRVSPTRVCDRDDLVQEAWLLLQKRIGQHVYTSLRWVQFDLIDIVRTRRNQASVSFCDLEDVIQETLLGSEDKALLRLETQECEDKRLHALECSIYKIARRMSPKLRDSLLYWLNGYSEKEAASRLGITVSAHGRRARKARRILADNL